VMDKCGLMFQEEVTHKGVLVAWYAIDRADWQASQAKASQSVARRIARSTGRALRLSR
jgi:hypothetical protein